MFGGGDTITGSNSGTTATIIDLLQASVPGYGLATRITYTVTGGTNFNLNDTIDNGSGVTASVIDGPIDEIGNAVEDVNSDVNITASRDSSSTKIDLQLGSLYKEESPWNDQLQWGILKSGSLLLFEYIFFNII